MATTPNGLRKQRMLLDGDEIISPALYQGENARATIEGINASVKPENTGPAWKVEVGGTNNVSYDDQTLVYYDAPSKQLKSSNIKITDLKAITDQMALLGPFTDQVVGAQTAVILRFSGSTAIIYSAAITLPANAEWRWLKMTGLSYFSYSPGGGNYPQFTVVINGVTQVPGDWFRADTQDGVAMVHVDEYGKYTMSWTWEGPVPAEFKAAATLTIVISLTMDDRTYHSSTKGYALGWHKPSTAPVVRDEDPNIVPLPLNFSATNFRLLFPGPTNGVYDSNKEYSYLEEVYESGGIKHLNWSYSRPYDYALKVLYTIEQRFNNGHPSAQTTAARAWLNNVYLPSTALVSQVPVGPFPDVSYQTVLLTNMSLQYTAGRRRIDYLQWKLGRSGVSEDLEGYYTRDFKAETIPYIP